MKQTCGMKCNFWMYFILKVKFSLFPYKVQPVLYNKTFNFIQNVVSVVVSAIYHDFRDSACPSA